MEVIEKVEELADNVVILKDENGEKFKQVVFDDVILPVSFLKMGAEKRFSYVKNFPYKDGDVLLCSYPKTGMDEHVICFRYKEKHVICKQHIIGTHWAANLLHFLMYDGSMEDMLSYTPCLIDMYNMEESQKREGRRIVTSHFMPNRLPTEHFANGGKTVLLFRNPKDTAVSMYFMLQRQTIFDEFMLSWNSFLNYWLEGKTVGGSYFDYYNSWQQMMQTFQERDILVVQYEDLKTDSMNQLRRIQNYLGLKHSDDRLQEILDRCSLRNLKADVDSGKIKSVLTDKSGKSILYRKGIVGDWKNHFTVAQNEKIEEIVNDTFKNSIFNYKAWDLY